MKRAFVYVGIACTILLSACGPQAPATAAPPPTPTATAQAAAQPATPTVAATTASTTSAPSSTPVAETATPVGACTDSASFVADVTIPDYTHLDAKEAFKKTWRVKNSGTCAWTADYKAVYSRGDALGAPLSVPLTDTAPGGLLDISADMVAPPSDGKYEIFYQLQNAKGDPMPIDAGDSLWALISVGKVYAAPPATPTTGPVPASNTTTLGPASCVYQANPTFVSQMVTLINAQRAAASPPLPALTVNDKLAAAAQSHSADMACNNYLSHTGWDGSTSESRIAAAGYAASISRENIYGQPPQYGGNAQAAVDWWMGDDIHRAAILNPQVTEIGAGYAAYSRSTLGGYFTVDFGAP